MYDPSIPAVDLVRLFDAVPDVVFFVKDRQCCYTHVNLTLVRRLGMRHAVEVIGHQASELFPEPLGVRYSRQDSLVLAGHNLDNQLEVHLFPNRSPGWCLTRKFSLRSCGETTGLVGISRDLRYPDPCDPVYAHLMPAMEYLGSHFAEQVRVATLARCADLSVAQLERQFMRVFQLSPAGMLTKLRIETAMKLLGGDDSIAAVGQACGYSDQSAFSRQFRKLTGLTPRQYRVLRVQHEDFAGTDKIVL